MVNLGLGRKDCQHTVIDEFLCMVTDYALGTDVCHWMFKTKVNMVQGQEYSPLTQSGATKSSKVEVTMGCKILNHVTVSSISYSSKSSQVFQIICVINVRQNGTLGELAWK